MYSKECTSKGLINSIFLVIALALSCNISAAPILINFEPSVPKALQPSGPFGITNASGEQGYQVLRDFTGSEYVGFSFSFFAGDEVRFTSAAGNFFDLLGLDIIGAWGQQTTTVRGYRGNDISFSLDVLIDRFEVDSLTLNWPDLTAFSIVTGDDFVYQPSPDCCGTFNINQIAFANVAISEEGQIPEPPSAVSEPGSFFLLALGFIGLAFARRQTA